MLAGVGMLGAHLRLGLGLRFVRPVAQDFLPKLAEFFDHALFGGMGIRAVGHGSVERVENVMQPGEQLRPVCQALIKRAARWGN